MTTPQELMLQRFHEHRLIVQQTVLDTAAVIDAKMREIAAEYNWQDKFHRAVTDEYAEAKKVWHSLSEEDHTFIVKLYEESKANRDEALLSLKSLQERVAASPYMLDRQEMILAEQEKEAQAAVELERIRKEREKAIADRLDDLKTDDYKDGCLVTAKSNAWDKTPKGEKPGWGAIHEALVSVIMQFAVKELKITAEEGGEALTNWAVKLAKEWDSARSKSKTRK